MDKSNVSITRLVELAKKGDSQAISILYVRHIEMMRKTVFGVVKDVQLAEDIAQDAFMHALDKLDQLERSETFSGWIHILARRMALSCVRRFAIQKFVSFTALSGDGETLTVIDRQPTSPEVCIEKERQEEVNQALGCLGRRDTEIIEAYHFEELTHNEMSEFFEIPGGTVRSRLSRARGKLRIIMTGYSSLCLGTY